MKICWDTLEKIKLTRNGTFSKGSHIYIEMESCKVCNDPYLARKCEPSIFCSISCVNSGKNNPMYGKTHTVESKKIISDTNSHYKGGISTLGLSRYSVYSDKLDSYETIRKQNNIDVLEARCAYCGRWYTPRYLEIRSRLVAIDNLNQGECRLYCSENCKQACPTYRQQKYPKGFKHLSSREVDPYLRKMVLERDNWTCQICGKTINEAQLHCHHMDPATQNPIFQNDMDSCITLCKGCHKMVHRQHGCRYIDLRCKPIRDINKKE